MEDSCLPNKPDIVLLIENPAKNTNLGSILRCASAFGITQIVAVGYGQCSVVGSHGASKHVEIVAFPVVKQALEYLRSTCVCASILGSLGCVPGGFGRRPVHINLENEIVKADRAKTSDSSNVTERHSIPIYEQRFEGNVCLALSRVREGLSATLARHCDAFVHVPHAEWDDLSSEPPNLLDTPSTMSIILYHAAIQLGLHERRFTGHKFDVATQKTSPDTTDSRLRNERSRQRELQRREELDEMETGSRNPNLFEHDSGDY